MNALTKPPRKLRHLDGLEKAFWLLNQHRNTHFSVIADVEGFSNIEPWQTAVETIGKQLPFVSAQISIDVDGAPFFEVGSPRAIPMTVVAAAGQGWARHVEEELACPFDTAVDPLVRLRLVVDGTKCAAILSMHHSVGDGPSAVYLLRDILRSTGGDTVVLSINTRSLEDALDDKGLPAGNFIPTPEDKLYPPPGYRPADLSRPSVTLRAIEAGELASLRARAKREKATLHGALCAAAARAFSRAKPDHPVVPPRVFSPIDVRRRLFDNTEHLGVYVNAVTVSLFKFEDDFWEDARSYSREVGLFNNADVLAYGIRQVQAAVQGRPSVEMAAAVWTQVYGAEIIVSNLGSLDLPTVYGDIRLKGIWGPAVSTGIAQEQTVGAMTLGGQLHLLHTSFDPVVDFLDVMVEILRIACHPSR
jgi:hypothetical protein